MAGSPETQHSSNYQVASGCHRHKTCAELFFLLLSSNLLLHLKSWISAVQSGRELPILLLRRCIIRPAITYCVCILTKSQMCPQLSKGLKPHRQYERQSSKLRKMYERVPGSTSVLVTLFKHFFTVPMFPPYFTCDATRDFILDMYLYILVLSKPKWKVVA